MANSYFELTKAFNHQRPHVALVSGQGHGYAGRAIRCRCAEGGTFNPTDVALRVLEKVVSAQTKRTE